MLWPPVFRELDFREVKVVLLSIKMKFSFTLVENVNFIPVKCIVHSCITNNFIYNQHHNYIFIIVQCDRSFFFVFSLSVILLLVKAHQSACCQLPLCLSYYLSLFLSWEKKLNRKSIILVQIHFQVSCVLLTFSWHLPKLVISLCLYASSHVSTSDCTLTNTCVHPAHFTFEVHLFWFPGGFSIKKSYFVVHQAEQVWPEVIDKVFFIPSGKRTLILSMNFFLLPTAFQRKLTLGLFKYLVWLEVNVLTSIIL